MTKFEKFIDWTIESIGTIWSLMLHALWFLLWFVIKLDINVLTMLVSLEAIFLSIFIQMNVNRHHTTSKKTHKKILDIEQKIAENELKR